MKSNKFSEKVPEVSRIQRFRREIQTPYNDFSVIPEIFSFIDVPH